MSLTLHVPMVVARNPVARSIERARLKAWHTNTALEMQLMQHGAYCESLLVGLAEALAIAIKASDDLDDPNDIRGDLTRAMGYLVDMTNAGRVWDSQHAEALTEALDVAAQLLGVVEPQRKVSAWDWMNRAREDADA